MMHPCAKAFKTIRLANGLTQPQFAEKLDISHSHIGQIEQGRSIPSYELMQKVIENFYVDANLFFGGGNVQVILNNSYYKLISEMTQEQLEGIKSLLKHVTNVSILKYETLADAVEGNN